jgi:hypothetical protein
LQTARKRGAIPIIIIVTCDHIACPRVNHHDLMEMDVVCTIVQSRIVTLRMAIDRDAHGGRATFTIPVRVPSPIPVQTHKHDRYECIEPDWKLTLHS